jgi:hypothetical protein
MDFQVKSWLYLFVAIVAFAAFATTEKKYGKWVFLIVMFSVLTVAANKMLNIAEAK